MVDNNLIFLDDDEVDETRKNSGSKSDQHSHGKSNKLEEKLKLNIFNVFCALLKGLNLTPWKIYVLISIEFI